MRLPSSESKPIASKNAVGTAIVSPVLTALTTDVGRAVKQLSSNERGPATDDATILQIVATTLVAIEATLGRLTEQVSKIEQRIDEQVIRKEWYSIAEVALQLGKAEFTVREWCRHGRVSAHKRECGRGGKREWIISQDELERIRNKGLLPPGY